MAANTKLVAICIAKIGTVIIGVVLRSQAGRAFADRAVCQCHRVRMVDDRSTIREQRDHLAVSGARTVAVEGSTDQK